MRTASDCRGHIRSGLLLLCIIFLLVLVYGATPVFALVKTSRIAKDVLLFLGALSVAVGWFYRFKSPANNLLWRSAIAFVTAAYLVLVIPVYYFELNQWRWFLGSHPWVSMYAEPWARWRWSQVSVYLGVAGSFAGRGRSRIAFVVGATLLMILWESMGQWVY